ncbi:hypothetical protein L6452_09013 [Arctium lappa]|uniref:Uncharacterized protein n=1 Tax=Arctium lappa TaxID=4217 RepID=A0ACB9DJD8_ARCLA|nr:hypothetical protein L6452_09013 [Arctium lappa]
MSSGTGPDQLGVKRGLGENLKNRKKVGTNDSQQNSESDDDALSYLGDNARLSKSFGNNDNKSDHVSEKIENKSEEGFVNNTKSRTRNIGHRRRSNKSEMGR